MGEHEESSLRKKYVILKELSFELNGKRRILGEMDKVARESLLGPSTYDPRGDYIFITRSNGDLPSSSNFEDVLEALPGFESYYPSESSEKE